MSKLNKIHFIKQAIAESLLCVRNRLVLHLSPLSLESSLTLPYCHGIYL